MNIAEYAKKFTKLIRFASYMVVDKGMNACKFQRGLWEDIQEKVLKLTKYQEVLEWP